MSSYLIYTHLYYLILLMLIIYTVSSASFIINAKSSLCVCMNTGTLRHAHVTPHSSKIIIKHTNNKQLPKHQNTQSFLINNNPFFHFSQCHQRLIWMTQLHHTSAKLPKHLSEQYLSSSFYSSCCSPFPPSPTTIKADVMMRKITMKPL